MLSKILYVLGMSMLPIIELRGGIPLGAGLGLNWQTALIVAMVGNMLPIPFILLFLKPIFAWMKRKSSKLQKIAEKLEAKGEKAGEEIKKYEFWGLTLFVAIPLPGTGAWTGALASVVLDMSFGKSLLACALGVLGAGIILTIISFTNIWVGAILVLILCIIFVYPIIKRKIAKRKN